MRSFDLAIELRRARLDVSVADALVLDMPVKPGLDLMAVVGPDFLDAEWERANHVVNEIDGVGLGVSVVDPEGADARAPRQPVQPVALEGPLNPSIGDPEPMVALQVPDDPLRPEMVLAVKMQDLLGNLRRRLVRMVVRRGSLAGEAGLTLGLQRMPPPVKACTLDTEVSARLADIAPCLSMLENAQLPADLPRIVRHPPPSSTRRRLTVSR